MKQSENNDCLFRIYFKEFSFRVNAIWSERNVKSTLNFSSILDPGCKLDCKRDRYSGCIQLCDSEICVLVRRPANLHQPRHSWIRQYVDYLHSVIPPVS